MITLKKGINPENLVNYGFVKHYKNPTYILSKLPDDKLGYIEYDIERNVFQRRNAPNKLGLFITDPVRVMDYFAKCFKDKISGLRFYDLLEISENKKDVLREIEERDLDDKYEMLKVLVLIKARERK